LTTSSVAQSRPRSGTFASLRARRNYRLYFFGQIVSYCGSVMQDTALPWLVYERSHSPFLVGLLVFSRYGPYALLGAYGGVLADRFDNRRMLIVTQTTAMVDASLLTVAAFSHSTPLWVIFALATASGLTLAFDTPSKYALIYQLVDRDELANAVALSYSLQNSARVVGPALGGVLIAEFGAGWCFLINACSFVATLGALALMHREEFFPIKRAHVTSANRALREGLAYARKSRYILTLMSLALVGGFFGFSAMRTLLPVLAAETLHGGARLFGLLYASYGVGAVTGGLINARIGAVSWRRLMASTLSFNGAILLLAPTQSIPVAALLLLVVGGSWTMWSSQAQTSVQLVAPDNLRGRLISLYLASLLIGAPFGGLLAGWLAGIGGTALAFAVAGCAGVTASVAAIATRRRRPIVEQG
jgi:MFS family permease